MAIQAQLIIWYDVLATRCHHLQHKASRSRQRHQCNKRVEQYHKYVAAMNDAGIIDWYINLAEDKQTSMATGRDRKA